ncbi:tyrosine-type recombinase/integrase [Prevotella melaninogenica]|uniref:tyrosine-type recombinase/integrase n=1 Tax=Prevotella melaninogenica TaxID=28132 RepID=UPI001BA7A7B9|nr:tyrosine-type recombinase/integrase [Prevotella melaninogenica]QUB68112.1 tyrosine-type recombinase/integrase [Prevotella melaninogenica]QUB69150.1 tyrosine-type recombinase/integrase [Prevotella melaninogenica]
MAISQLISVNFNLRSPKAKTATPLYMVVYYLTTEGVSKQAKIPTGKKILPILWDSRKQQPIMINKGIDLTDKQLSEQAEITAYIANCRILAYQNNFSTFDEIKEKINLKENNDMSPVTQQFKAATRTAKATNLIDEALKQYTKDRKIKESTANEYEKNVKVFYQWLVNTNQRDSAKALTQSSFNAFVEWMKAGGDSPKKVNKIASVIRQLIKYLAGTQAGSKYNITPVTYTPIKEVKEEKKCELTKEEIEAFKAVKVKNDKEQYYKDVFLLQLATGQRISDTLKLIKGDYKVQEGTPYNTIILTTIKCTTTSYITETKEVTELLKAIRANKENETKKKKDNETKNKKENEAENKKENEAENKKYTSLTRYLKVFFTRAKLTRKVPSGKPLNEVISSHFARHTFVTIKLREGYTYEQVGKMIGDSATMIEKVYGHPTDTDIIATLQLQPQPANTPAQTAAGNTTAAPAVAKDNDLDYYNDLSDDDKLLYTKKLNDYNVLKDVFFSQLERQTERKRKATAETKAREILQVWGFEGANNMNYKKLCFLLDLIKHDINDFILTYKVYNEKAPQGSISAINDFERLIINIGKLASYL